MIEPITIKKAGPIQGVIIVLINMLPMMAIVALMPVVPAIVENFKDIPHITTWAPLVLSAPGLCIALVSPYAGVLVDKFGRRRLLIATMILYGIGGLIPFFVNSFPALMGGRLLLGVGEAFVMTLANVLLGDYFSVKARNWWLVVQSVAGSACGTLLLYTSGQLAASGWQYPFLVYSAALVFALLAWLFIFEPFEKTTLVKNADKVKMPLSLITKLCITTLVASTIWFVYTLQFSLALDEMGFKDRKELGKIFAAASIAVPIGSLLFKFLSSRAIGVQLLIMATLIGTGLLGIGLSHTKTFVMIFATIQQLGCGMTMPVLIGWGLNTLPPEFRGRGMGFWSSAFFLGQFISPLVVTGVKNMAGSLLNAFVVFGILCIALGIINYLFSKNKNVSLAENEMAVH